MGQGVHDRPGPVDVSLHGVGVRLAVRISALVRETLGGSCRHLLGEIRVEPFAAVLRDAKVPPEERLRCGCAEADEHARPDDT